MSKPVILAMPRKVTEVMLLALARKNPEYRFETMADGRLRRSTATTGSISHVGQGRFVKRHARRFELDKA